ncbi:hypothetical protein [Streptomyces sp. NPDC058268]|uniref:hypothetical protein n=1 Tax=Streptomyces sp. NPDC058268 TaxID=3346413 RepID=UPI0036EEEA87
MGTSLAEDMRRVPVSFTIHRDVMLAQYARVAEVGQWIGLAATALRRDLLEHLGRAPAAEERPLAPEGGGLSRYRVVAQRTDEAHPGAVVLTNFAYGRSVEEAVAAVRADNEKPGGLYGDAGLYRVVEVAEEDAGASEARHEELARVRCVNTIMDAALASTSLEPQDLDPEVFGILCDFFTRAVVFPGRLPHDDGQLHTSDPSRALARLLLQHLGHHDMDLGEVVAVAGWDPLPERLKVDRAAGEQRLAARDEDEGSSAGAGLIERVLAVSEQHFAAVTGTSSEQWDKELSRELVGVALRTVHLADREAYPQALEEYLGANRARLKQLWHVYGPAGVFPRGVYHLVELPGSLVLCERLASAPMWLEGVWARECESDTPLERLREAWLHGTDKDGER